MSIFDLRCEDDSWREDSPQAHFAKGRPLRVPEKGWKKVTSTKTVTSEQAFAIAADQFWGNADHGLSQQEAVALMESAGYAGGLKVMRRVSAVYEGLKDTEKAEFWKRECVLLALQLAVQPYREHSDALRCLSYAAAYGRGIPQSAEQFFFWLRLTAQEDARALHTLRAFWLDGDFLPCDEASADYWEQWDEQGRAPEYPSDCLERLGVCAAQKGMLEAVCGTAREAVRLAHQESYTVYDVNAEKRDGMGGAVRSAFAKGAVKENYVLLPGEPFEQELCSEEWLNAQLERVDHDWAALMQQYGVPPELQSPAKVLALCDHCAAHGIEVPDAAVCKRFAGLFRKPGEPDDLEHLLRLFDYVDCTENPFGRYFVLRIMERIYNDGKRSCGILGDRMKTDPAYLPAWRLYYEGRDYPKTLEAYQAFVKSGKRGAANAAGEAASLLRSCLGRLDDPEIARYESYAKENGGVYADLMPPNGVCAGLEKRPDQRTGAAPIDGCLPPGDHAAGRCPLHLRRGSAALFGGRRSCGRRAGKLAGAKPRPAYRQAGI